MVKLLKQNSKRFWKTYHWFILIFFIALSLDVISTIDFMEEMGPENEINPFIRFISCEYGIYFGPILGALIRGFLAILLAVYMKTFAILIFSLTSASYFFAVLYNYFAIDLYTNGWLPF